MKARLPLIAALAVALSPLEASAQAWVSNPDFAEGVGIRAGDFELHLSAGAEFGYDNNFYRASDAEGKVDVFKLRVTPSFSLGSLGSKRRDAPTPPDVTFKLGGYLSYNEIIPADSENKDAAEQRNVGAGVDASVNIFPARKVGFDLLAAYVRTLETDGTSEDLAGDGFDRASARGGAGVTWRPGGGVFEWRAGYTATYNYFLDEELDNLTNIHHDVGTRGRWRFLPRSALLFDAGYSFVRYTEEGTPQTDGDAVRARMGFHGLVTYHLSLLGMLGWASSFYEPHDGSYNATQYDSFVANAEARWFIMPRPSLDSTTITSGLSSIALGYVRGFGNSYYGSYYQSDRGYLQFTMFLLGAIAGGVEFGVTRMGYPEVITTTGETEAAFAQARYDGRVFAEYRITDIVATNATFQYDQVNSPTVGGQDLDYSRWQAFVGARVFW